MAGKMEQTDATTDFGLLEDPARGYLDLVMACKSSDPAKVRSVIEQARKSEWTWEKWDKMCRMCESDGDFEAEGSDIESDDE